MSTELIKYAFIAGEISPTLFGRTDLTKYDLGMALTKNWYVDYRGGLSTRPGTEFLDYLREDDKLFKLVQFQFSPDLSNTYLIIFGHKYIRFMQDGAYVLTGEKTITGIDTSDEKVVVTSAGHGYANGDWVKLNEVLGISNLNGKSFVVANATTDTFELIFPNTGMPIERTGQSWVSGGKIYKIYEIDSPYESGDLAALSAFQIRDLVRLTHVDFPIKNLVRNDHDDWELVDEEIGGLSFSTTDWNLTVQGATPGSDDAKMTVVYAVAAVFDDGAESSPSLPVRSNVCVDFTVQRGWVRVQWNPIPGAVEYILYRTTIAVGTGAPVSAGSQLGFVTRTKSTYFLDSNIIPDFTKGPYENYNPFAVGSIKSLEVTAAGSGYNFLAPLTASGGAGSGFEGYAIVDNDGKLVNAVIVNAGSGYSDPVTITVGGSGTGGAVSAELAEASGTYPALSTIFQQRQAYAASLTQPMTLWASQIKLYNNFDTSTYIIDSNSYEFEVDAAQVAPLLHIFSLRGGLLMLSQTGVWLLTGGQTGPVTPTNALADPQSYTGVSPVRPIQIGSDLLYVEGKGFSVRLLSYNDFSKVYSGEDKSILSNHLFSIDRQIIDWTFAENPYKIVFGVRSDGALLMFTTVKEQDVYAWTWGQTRGFFKNILSIPENGVDSIYTVVQRKINGGTRKYIERFAGQDWTYAEDAFAVDCGLRFSPAPSSGTLDVSAETMTTDGAFVTLTTSEDFTGKEGWWVRGCGGIFVIREVVSATEALAKVIYPATNIWPETPGDPVITAQVGEWSISQPQTEFSGLDHIEGEEVSILGDGNVFPKQVVTDGKISLPDGVSKVSVGLGFTAIAQTLPPTVTDLPIEARRKRTVGVAVRLHRSRGLMSGRTLTNLYNMRERKNEPYGTPIDPTSGYQYVMLETDWEEDAQTYFVQEYPLPATMLGLVPDLEVGDDTN